jgi:hypothetical protein
MLRSSSRRVWVVVGALLVTAACNDQPKLEVGGTCLLNSDCNLPLVCTMNKCHEACRVTTDCPPGQSCVKVAGAGVCQLPAETSCSASVACGQLLICASDLRCRAVCNSVADCTSGQVCVQTFCAETRELVNGALPQLQPVALDAGSVEAGVEAGTDARADAGSDLPLDAAADVLVPDSAADIAVPACPVGSETCACYGNDTCNAGLMCIAHLCVRMSATGGSAGNGGTSGAGGIVGSGGTRSTGTGGTIGTGGAGGGRDGGGSDNAGTGGTMATGGSTGNTDAGSPDAAADLSSDLATQPDAPSPQDAPAEQAVIEASSGQVTSLWDESVTAEAQPFCDWDNQPVDLGIEFTTDVAGEILAVRFYKDSRNNGQHSAYVWSGDRQLLAEAPFVAETDSGWQRAALPTPASLAAGGTYVVSYHSETGYSYSYEVTPPTVGPFHVTGGGNGGYYCYGEPPCPPAAFSGINYWVDFDFMPSQ